MSVLGIVLGGGLSKRFRVKGIKDKLLLEVNGEPMILRVINSIRGLCDKVVVVTRSGRKGIYKRILNEGIDVFEDIKDMNCKGPMRGVATAIALSDSYERALIVPGDMPFLKSEVIEMFLQESKGFNACGFVWPDGFIEPLIQVLNLNWARRAVRILCLLGRSRMTDIFRGAGEIKLISILKVKTFDPLLSSFININNPEDLNIKGIRAPSGSTKDIILRVASGGPPELKDLIKYRHELFWGFLYNMMSGNVTQALKLLENEARIYTTKKLKLLTAHVYIDMYEITKSSEERKRFSLKIKEIYSSFKKEWIFKD